MRFSLVQAMIMDEPLAITMGKLETILAIVAEREGLDVQADSFVGAGPSTSLQAVGQVGIIPVTGTLTHRPTGLSALSGLTSYNGIDAQLDAALADNTVEHIVLDVNTPGGMVSGLFDLADRIKAATDIKPITAIINESAYSAGYALASAATEIIVPRTGGVGSIGVVTAHEDRSAANEKAGRKVTYITAGDKKAYGNPDEPLSDAALAEIQARVNTAYDLFVETIARNRNLTPEAVRATQAGVFQGSAAIAQGLADKVMPARDALQMIVDRYKPTSSQKRISRRARAIAIQS